MDTIALFKEVMREPVTELVLVCMECGSTYGTKDAKGAKPTISHGYCDPCGKIVEERFTKELE